MVQKRVPFLRNVKVLFLDSLDAIFTNHSAFNNYFSKLFLLFTDLDYTLYLLLKLT